MNLEEIIEKEIKLPPSAQILPKLLGVLQSEDSANWEMAKLIKLDQSLGSQVLNLSNSAYYGFTTPCSDIEEAIGRVGTNEIYKLVCVIVSMRMMSNSVGFYCLDEGQLWESSLAGAFGMEALAKRTGGDPNIAYTIGLMHGIGKLVIDQACKEDYMKVFELVEAKNCTLAEAERKILGFDHCRAGEALLKKWNFQAEISETVKYQFRPLDSTRAEKLACMMNLTHVIILGVGTSHGRDAMAFNVEPEATKRLGISEEDIELILTDVLPEIEIVKQELANAAKQ